MHPKDGRWHIITILILHGGGWHPHFGSWSSFSRRKVFDGWKDWRESHIITSSVLSQTSQGARPWQALTTVCAVLIFGVFMRIELTTDQQRGLKCLRCTIVWNFHIKKIIFFTCISNGGTEYAHIEDFNIYIKVASLAFFFFFFFLIDIATRY